MNDIFDTIKIIIDRIKQNYISVNWGELVTHAVATIITFVF